MIDSRIHLREDTVITLFLLFEEFQRIDYWGRGGCRLAYNVSAA
jgi:hypothetical protein